MTEEVKHTPLPWYVAKQKGKSQRTIMGDGGIAVANANPCRDRQGHHHAKANAAFIVRAVNSHYELVEALREAQNSLEGVLNTVGLHRKIYEALAKAKGEA